MLPACPSHVTIAAAISFAALSLSEALPAFASDELDSTMTQLEGTGDFAGMGFSGWLLMASLAYWLVKAVSYLFTEDHSVRASTRAYMHVR